MNRAVMAALSLACAIAASDYALSRDENPVENSSNGAQSQDLPKVDLLNDARGITLSIEPVRRDRNHAFKGGEPVLIAATISNHSDATLIYYDSHGERDVEFNPHVETANGTDISRTSYGAQADNIRKKSDVPLSVSGVFTKIAPGAAERYVINVGRQFDLTLNGDYVVQLSRDLPRPGGDTKLISNKLTVRVR